MQFKAIRYCIIVGILIGVPPALDACFCPCGCGGGGGTPEYDIGEMHIGVHPVSTASPTPPQPPFKFSEIYFQVYLSPKLAMLLSPMGTSAYACQPPEPIANQRISAIVITSDKDFVGSPATFTAGSDMSPVFLFSFWDVGTQSLDQAINKQIIGERIVFSSKAMADNAQSHTFTFRITLDDGQVFELVTEKVELRAG